MRPDAREPGVQELVEALAAFARTLARGYEIADVLHDLTARAAAMLRIKGAGVSLLRGEVLEFITADSELFRDLEMVQEQHQQGPCIDAVSSGAVVTCADLDADDRWPAYATRGRQIGVRAVAGVPMRIDGATIGAVDLYHDQPHEWSESELTLARILCDMATSYVVNASRLDQQRRTAEHLQRALDSRVVIEQAKGIIAAQRHVSVDDAWKILRKHANDHQATLHSTADAVVHLGLRP